MSERWEGGTEDILGYCNYCKDLVHEGEGHIYIDNNYYHYDPVNPYKNCYYPEQEEE